MNPKIEARGPMHFVGICDYFISIHLPNANNFAVIPALWGRFYEVVEATEESAVADALNYGVIISGDPGAGPEELAYIASRRLTSEPAEELPGMRSYTTPEATYAIVEHRGPIANLGQTLRAFGQWLDASEYRHTQGPEVEVYPEGYDPSCEDSAMETWIPIEKM